MSESGAFLGKVIDRADLRIASDIPVGSNIELELYLPDDGTYQKIRTNSTVIWKDSKTNRDNIELAFV